MRYPVAIALALAVASTLVACGGGGGGTSSSDSTNNTASTSSGNTSASTVNQNGSTGAQPSYAATVVDSVIQTPVVIPQPSERATAENKTFFGRYEYVRNVRTIDVNGDGLDDLFVAPSFFDQYPVMPVEIWINQGDGSFQNQTSTWIDGPVPTTTFTAAILVADFNGDGRSDVMAVQTGLEDLDCYNPGCNGSSNLLMLSQPDGHLKDVSATNLPDNGSWFNHVVTSVGDINGDGLIDIAFPRLGGPKFDGQGLVLLINQGGGVFAEAPASMVPPEIRFMTNEALSAEPSTLDRQAVYSAAIADATGDGKPDLIVGSGGYGDALTNAQTVRIFSWNPATQALVEAGRIPIAPALAPIQNVGFAGADLPSSNHNGLGAAHMSVADFDHDGIPDVLINWEAWTANYAQLMKGKTGTTFDDVTVASLGGYETSYASNGYNWTILTQAAMDVNGDGFPDFVLGSSGNTAGQLAGGSPAAAWINDGRGHFQKQQLYLNGTPAASATITGALGCSTCGYETYYGRFLKRSDTKTTLDMLLLAPSAYRSTPVDEEDAIGVHVFQAQ